MVWLVVLVLAIAVWRLHRSVGRLSEALERATLRLASLEASSGPAVDAVADAPAYAPPLVLPTPADPSEAPAQDDLTVRSEAPMATPSAKPRRTIDVSAWLSENGLAWLGGGALALGGLLLVGYAAQRGVFTPGLRIVAAVALGVAMLVAGEWIRSRPTPHLRHGLAAAVISGAGAATLYAVTWAAFALYGFISVETAGAALGVISFGLFALSFRHGQPLGALAVVAAFVAPIVSESARWNDAALGGYLLLVLVTGLGIGARREWPAVRALSALAGTLWAFHLAQSDQPLEAAALTAATVLIAGLLRQAEQDQRERTAAATIVVLASAISLWMWEGASAARLESGAMMLGAFTSLLAIMVACALGSVRGRLHAAVLASPAVTMVAGLLLSSDTDPSMGGLAGVLGLIAVFAACGLVATLLAPHRVAAALATALGVVVPLALIAPSLDAVFPAFDPLILAGAALTLAAGAVAVARRSADRTSDAALLTWIGAASAVSALALDATVDFRLTPTALSLLGLALATLSRRLDWRGFTEAAGAAALLAFASLLAQPFVGAAFSGGLAWRPLVAVVAPAVIVQALSWRLLRHGQPSALGPDAASTSALLSGLFGLFLVLRLLATPEGRSPAALDPFAEQALSTLLLLAAGLCLAVRPAATRFGAIRANALLIVGAVHGLVVSGLLLNPWWGLTSRVPGPPVVDLIALAYLAPAILLAFAARRANAPPRMRTGCATASALFGALYVLLELRRLFQGPQLDIDRLGHAELAAYAVALLSAGLAAWRVRGLGGHDLSRPARLVAGVALVGSGLLLALASPWWGVVPGDLRLPWLFLGLYGVAVTLAAVLARWARSEGDATLAEAASAAAVVFGFVLVTLTIRYLYRGQDMRPDLQEASLETWTYSAVWALYGLAALVLAVRRHSATLRWVALGLLFATTAKVFLFDLSRLEGVVRAASFLALGAMLLAGALAARRFSRSAPR